MAWALTMQCGLHILHSRGMVATIPKAETMHGSGAEIVRLDGPQSGPTGGETGTERTA